MEAARRCVLAMSGRLRVARLVLPHFTFGRRSRDYSDDYDHRGHALIVRRGNHIFGVHTAHPARRHGRHVMASFGLDVVQPHCSL